MFWPACAAQASDAKAEVFGTYVTFNADIRHTSVQVNSAAIDQEGQRTHGERASRPTTQHQDPNPSA